jgi:hypothetical protein
MEEAIMTSNGTVFLRGLFELCAAGARRQALSDSK